MKTVEENQEVRLNVRVTGGLAQYVQEQISPGGLYEGQSELVREALRQHRDKNDHAELAASVDRGLDDIKNGRYKKWDGERVHAEAKAELAKIREK